MPFKAIPTFINSAAALLVGLAVAVFIANAASPGLTQPRDPLLLLSMRTVFWIVGALALAVGGVCLFAKRDALKTGLILWLVLNLVVYQIGFAWSGSQGGIGVYLSSIATTFALSPGATNLILKIASGYLFIGSALTLLWLWREKAQGYLKTVCAHCGGHIAFPPQDLERKIACPHCQSHTTLRRPEDRLKMSCYFCQGHIEFPAHALGTKMQCPHCEKDITLVEPR
jgi:DNA-directed RNA polymerase subunit RPC12/RpoP